MVNTAGPVENQRRSERVHYQRVQPRYDLASEEIQGLGRHEHVPHADGGRREKNRQVVEFFDIFGLQHSDSRKRGKQSDTQTDHRGGNMMPEVGHP